MRFTSSSHTVQMSNLDRLSNMYPPSARIGSIYIPELELQMTSDPHAKRDDMSIPASGVECAARRYVWVEFCEAAMRAKAVSY